MARRQIFDVPLMPCMAISLVCHAFACGGANAQVNADTTIRCVAPRRGTAFAPIDILIDFRRNTINGASADGRFRKEPGGELSAYSIFSGNFILSVDSWTDGSGGSGVRSINYITIDRIHSSVRATTVTVPDGRSISSRGDCEIVAARAPAP